MLLNRKFLITLLGSFCIYITTSAESMYWREFQALKKDPSYELAFDCDVSPLVQYGAKEVENIKKIDNWSRSVRPIIVMAGGIIIDENTMPLLYGYVDALCKAKGIETPVVAVTPHKGFCNAVAEKFLENSGAIVLWHDLLKECSEEEIEAVIARELGHIKYNHMNKLLALECARLLVLSQLYQHSVLTGFNCFFLYMFVPYLLVGKKFEWEADNFACKDAFKAKGLIRFLERLQYKESKSDADFDKLHARTVQVAPTVNEGDQMEMWINYYILKKVNNFGKYCMWLYYNASLGAYPSTAERIENAQRILEQQE